MDIQLTPENEEKLKEYLAETLKLGLQTQKEPYNTEEVRRKVDALYARFNLGPPAIYYAKSIRMASTMATIFKPFWDEGFTAEAKLRTVNQELGADSIYEPTVNIMAPQVIENLGLPNNLLGAVKNQLQSYVTSIGSEINGHYIAGSQALYWLQYYSFINNELPVEKTTAPLDEMTSLCKTIGWFWPYDQNIFISEHPITLSVENERLHSNAGPAIEFADGTKRYMLYGVPVKEWVIETPRDQIDLKKVLQISNTEERYACMRHIGMSAFLDVFKAEELDSEGDYRLYYLNVDVENRGTTVKVGPYLFMKCPSTGREFLEGLGDAEKYERIDPTIKTVEQALEWRYLRASGGLMTHFDRSKFEYGA